MRLRSGGEAEKVDAEHPRRGRAAPRRTVGQATPSAVTPGSAQQGYYGVAKGDGVGSNPFTQGMKHTREGKDGVLVDEYVNTTHKNTAYKYIPGVRGGQPASVILGPMPAIVVHASRLGFFDHMQTAVIIEYYLETIRTALPDATEWLIVATSGGTGQKIGTEDTRSI